MKCCRETPASSLSKETQAQHFLLESADRLELQNVTAEPVTLQGKKGLQLTLPEQVRQRVKRLESMTPEEREV